MNGFRQWVLTLLAVAAFLLMVSRIDAGWIYNVNGVMAPTLSNPVSASFTGKIEFPTDLATEGILRIGLTNEIDPVTQQQIVREAPFSMSANLNDPIGMRIFNGTFDDEPFAMQWIDFDRVAQSDFAAWNLTDGGEWDAWGIGFSDYSLGTITDVYNRQEIPSVNEPAGLALLAVGGLFLIGMIRAREAH